MQAKDLKAGDLFTVNPPDPEGPVRVCISNDNDGIKWGFPNKPGCPYWGWMGPLCEVKLVKPDQMMDIAKR